MLSSLHEGLIKQRYLFYRYSFPSMLLISVLIFSLFLNYVPACDKHMAKVFKWLSSVSFGVYVAHSHPVLLDRIFISQYFNCFRDFNNVLFIALLLCGVIIIYLFFGFIEYLHQKLIILIGTNRLEILIGNKLDIFLHWNE